jgi:phosphoribosylamine--glycine ligase/phosphoribosylaminoimidazole synthetase
VSSLEDGLAVLVVGGGGREHAMAAAVLRSPRCRRLVVAPGNAGTPGERVIVPADDVDGLVKLARGEGIDLVLVGPEAALAAGLVDRLHEEGIAAFGPTRAAAELEWSKAFTRQMCERHGIPSPRYATFDVVDDAMDWADALAAPVVVKADGLAAGKGVLLPEDRESTLAALRLVLEDAAFGAAGARVVLEERLVGEEVSLLAFTDGRVVVPMPPAQDHKRLLDGDRGPNTGGMGAYAPAPVCPPALAGAIAQDVLGPAVAGMADAGRPYQGVLYAGIILTADGPRVLEFNCRFGDPEAQAILPLLASDLLDVAEACATGTLTEATVRWHPGAACAVVIAAPGYPEAPERGLPISGTDAAAALDGVEVFHAGTEELAGVTVTAGGRVLTVTGIGHDVAAARARAYAAVDGIGLERAQVRRDIGWRALARTGAAGGYAAAGVDVAAGAAAVERMRGAIESTHTEHVLAGVGAFGGALSAAVLRDLQDPVIVASTDGIGTKVVVASAAGRLDGLGHDIVNHCINDVLVQDARPLFFLDYLGTSRLDPIEAAAIVAGIAEACRAGGCVLLGGETAEMPGVYREGHLDVVGTLVGVAERARLLPRSDIAAGDVVIGLASSGPHTNGYSLLRRVFAGVPLDVSPDGLDVTLADALLAPHRSYLPVLRAELDRPERRIKALAHITGGGLLDNLPRVLPDGLGALVRLGSWPVPPLFRLVRDATGLPPDELHRALNMGIGMVLVVGAADAAAVADDLPEESWVVGEVVAGKRQVALV